MFIGLSYLFHSLAAALAFWRLEPSCASGVCSAAVQIGFFLNRSWWGAMFYAVAGALCLGLSKNRFSVSCRRGAVPRRVNRLRVRSNRGNLLNLLEICCGGCPAGHIILFSAEKIHNQGEKACGGRSGFAGCCCSHNHAHEPDDC